MFASYEARKGVGGACCPDASHAGRHGSRHGRARPSVPKGTAHGPRRAARKDAQATEASAPVRKRRAVPGNPDPPTEQTPAGATASREGRPVHAAAPLDGELTDLSGRRRTDGQPPDGPLPSRWLPRQNSPRPGPRDRPALLQRGTWGSSLQAGRMYVSAASEFGGGKWGLVGVLRSTQLSAKGSESRGPEWSSLLRHLTYCLVFTEAINTCWDKVGTLFSGRTSALAGGSAQGDTPSLSPALRPSGPTRRLAGSRGLGLLSSPLGPPRGQRLPRPAQPRKAVSKGLGTRTVVRDQ